MIEPEQDTVDKNGERKLKVYRGKKKREEEKEEENVIRNVQKEKIYR